MNADQKTIRQFQNGDGAALRIRSSPIADAMNGAITRLQSDPPKIELTFEPGVQFTQAADLIQGGAIATMLDLAMAFVAMMKLPDGYSVATANLNVSYLRAAKSGTLRATAEIERFGRNLIFARASLADAAGIILATGSSTLSALTPK